MLCGVRQIKLDDTLVAYLRARVYAAAFYARLKKLHKAERLVVLRDFPPRRVNAACSGRKTDKNSPRHAVFVAV